MGRQEHEDLRRLVPHGPAFVDHTHLIFDKACLDAAAKKKGLADHFKLEIYLREAEGAEYDPSGDSGISDESDTDTEDEAELAGGG